MRKILRKLKVTLRSYMLDIAYQLFNRQTRTALVNNNDSVLILPAADGWDGDGPHGFGDEMLMLGLLEGLKSRFAGKISALRMEGQGGNVFFHGHAIRMIGFPKGWLAGPSYRQFADIASTYSHFIIIGADVLDGAYGAFNSIQRLRFLNIAAKMGLKTAITGCSFNGTTNQQICTLLKTAEHNGTAIHARDKVSSDRFGVFLHKVNDVADLAFMVDAEQYPVANRVEAIRNRAAGWKSAGGIVVGINLCGWHINEKDRFFDYFIAELLKLDESLDKIGSILLPHDTRTDRWSDLDTLEELRKRIDNRIEIIGAPQEIKSGIDAKQAVRCCDVLLTGRMHLAIAAHDQGIPSVSFGYQGKFEGFYGLYGMGAEWLVEYDNPTGAVGTLQLALVQRDELSSRIVEKEAIIQAAARQNFEWLD